MLIERQPRWGSKWKHCIDASLCAACSKLVTVIYSWVGLVTLVEGVLGLLFSVCLLNFLALLIFFFFLNKLFGDFTPIFSFILLLR